MSGFTCHPGGQGFGADPSGGFAADAGDFDGSGEAAIAIPNDSKLKVSPKQGVRTVRNPMISLATSAWGRRASRVELALLTAALLVLSFPNPDQGWLAWVALVPLLLACHGLGAVSAGAVGLLSGTAAAYAPSMDPPCAGSIADATGWWPPRKDSTTSPR